MIIKLNDERVITEFLMVDGERHVKINDIIFMRVEEYIELLQKADDNTINIPRIIK